MMQLVLCLFVVRRRLLLQNIVVMLVLVRENIPEMHVTDLLKYGTMNEMLVHLVVLVLALVLLVPIIMVSVQ